MHISCALTINRHTCQGAVSRRWAAFLSAPSSSLACLVDEISGLPCNHRDVMIRSPEPSPSHRNHQIVSPATTVSSRRIGYQRQDHVSNQLAPFFSSHPFWRAPHHLQSLLHEHRHESVIQLRSHCTITFRKIPNFLLNLITETHHKHVTHLKTFTVLVVVLRAQLVMNIECAPDCLSRDFVVVNFFVDQPGTAPCSKYEVVLQKERRVVRVALPEQNSSIRCWTAANACSAELFRYLACTVSHSRLTHLASNSLITIKMYCRGQH